MDGSDITEVCRLCPAHGANQGLLSVFDERISDKNNMKEVILVTTGIEILENDLVSKKICQRCCNITLKMFQFRQDAYKQDRALKEKCTQYLGDKGIRLPNTCITIKQERRDLLSLVKKLKRGLAIETSPKPNLKETLHPSIKQLYQNFPDLKLPRACVDMHMSPVVSLPMGQVESYFRKRKLNMKHYVYKQRRKPQVKEPSRKVAKKSTSVPSHVKKTVAPLKISKKLFERHMESTNSVESYVCTPANKLNAVRKRSVSSSDADGRSKSKVIKESEHHTLSSTSTDSRSELKKLTPTPSSSNDTIAHGTPVRGETTAPEPSEENTENSASNSTADNNSPTSRNIYKPEFLESFGLTPTVTAIKSQTLLVCNLCGSVHNNAFELKRHTTKHMVCQFCKRRFKSLEAKQDHIDNICEIKRIMNSSEPVVNLEAVHLNLAIRKKYPDAFSSFEDIPGLQEVTPMEEEAIGKAVPVQGEHVIVLSDDDDKHFTSVDRFSGTLAANMPSPIIETLLYKTVSVIKPDVRIKNNAIPNNLATNMDDKQLLRNLINPLQPKKVTIEKMLQTELPANRDIKINNLEGTCEFKNLKEQLLTYKVPINISHGSFHVGYQFKSNSKPNSMVGLWNALPVVDVKKPAQNSSGKTNANPLSSYTNQPKCVIIANNRQPPVASVSSTSTVSLPSRPNNIVIQTSNVTSGVMVNTNAIRVSQPPINSVASNSATPLLQNYALSMGQTIPVINRSIRIPNTFVSSAINNRNMFRNEAGIRPATHTMRHLQRSSLPNSGIPPRSSTPINSLGYIRYTPTYTPNSVITSSTVLRVEPPLIQPVAGSNNNSVPSAAASSETATFRVKNVWELRISESDIISKKICEKCYKNVREIEEIRQTAVRQDQHLKEKCQQYLTDKGIRLPNTCITIKKDLPCEFKEQKPAASSVVCAPAKTINCSSSPSKHVKGNKGIHPSVIDVYRKYPRFKLPKRCLERHVAPIVSLAMDEVETYFRKNKLDMNKYIYKSTVNGIQHQTVNNVARKKTGAIIASKTLKTSQNDHSNDVYYSEILKGDKIPVYNPFMPQEADKSKQDNGSITPKIQPNTSSMAHEVPTNNGSNHNQLLRSISETTQQTISSSKVTCSLYNTSAAEEDTKSRMIMNTVVCKAKRKMLFSSNIIRTPKVMKTDKTATTIKPTDSTPPLEATRSITTSKEDPSLPNTTKPEFIQSLGLTPAIAGQPQKILICKICDSVHQNLAALKKHTSRHRVCPFCKLKFRSVEKKQNHINHNCEVKKIIESPGSFVSLEKIECNLHVREQYKDVFVALELIPELNEQLPDEVICLSDDEEGQLNGCEKDVATNVLKPEESKIESVSVVKPIVSIHNNTTLDGIANNLSDLRLIKELIWILKKMQLPIMELTVQTTLPCNKDIVVNKNETCRLKNFKSNLWSYFVPVTLGNGDFNVSYSASVESKKKSVLEDWNDVPLTEKRTQKIPLMNTTYPLTFVTSQVQSSQLSLSSIQLMTGTPTMSIFLPNTSAFIPSAGLSIQPSINNTVNQTQTINNTFFSPISTTSLQTAPLLQNYTLSMTPLPIINNQMPIQTNTTVSSTIAGNDNSAESTVVSSTVDNTVSSSSTVVSSSTDSSLRKSLPIAVSKTKKMCLSPRRSLSVTTKTPSKMKVLSKKQFLKVKMGNVAACTSSTSKSSSKLRVKNIWELK